MNLWIFLNIQLIGTFPIIKHFELENPMQIIRILKIFDVELDFDNFKNLHKNIPITCYTYKNECSMNFDNI